ncbi:unnamed protein product [Adineta steineri]|uniref:Uncharacterized protein n=1 Tax=Adineta steineri TaxID=433720 RepID=A0A813P7L7_9BILA|nr:unnamed protein product [Adineta steineri]CAF4023377.1 unnamed protein product [Adineta steineri]
MERYERGIDKEIEENGNYSPFYFALLCNLHNNQKHAKAAMIALDNLYDDLEKNPEHEKKWQQMLNDIREMKDKQISLSGSLQDIIQNIANGDNTGVLNNLVLLLVDNTAILENIEKNRNQVKMDIEHFSNDKNTIRQKFYKKMRVTLSHTFTAMCVTTEVGGGPIVKHDRTGTESLIADGVGLLGSFLGAHMPAGGGVVSSLADRLGSVLRDHEYKRYEERMALITDVGTVEELTNVSRQVARELADRYEEQLLSLTANPHHKRRICSWCCRCFRKDQENQPSANDNSKEETNSAEKIAKFGIASIVKAILHDDIDEAKEYNDIEPKDLAHILVAVTCRAKPEIKSKVRRKLNLEKKAILLHERLKSSKQETPVAWNLYDFYRKPGIQLIDNTAATTQPEPLSWMEPELYGSRLGTQKEYDYLASLDKKETNNMKKYCCCWKKSS